MISILADIARLLRKTLDSMATPCSVSAVTRLENFRFEDVTSCDIRMISGALSYGPATAPVSESGALSCRAVYAYPLAARRALFLLPCLYICFRFWC